MSPITRANERHLVVIEEVRPEIDGGPDRPYQVHDLLSDAHYLWHGVRNYIELNPSIVPAHIFRSEQNFDYFMEAT